MIELLSRENKNSNPQKEILINKINQHLEELSRQETIPDRPPLKKEHCTTVELKYFFLLSLKTLIENNTPLHESSLKMLVNEFAIKKITTHYAQPGEIHISELKRNYVFKGVCSTTKQLYQEALDLSQRRSPGSN